MSSKPSYLQVKQRMLRKYFHASRYILQDGGLSAFKNAIKQHFQKDNVKEYHMAFDILQATHNSGCMIDVGAHIGEASARFAYHGWCVIAFEPDESNRKRLSAVLGNLPNVRVDRRAISDSVEQQAIFYRSQTFDGIGSLSPFHSSHHPGNRVDVITLTHFFDELDESLLINNVDFLKVDAEGYDLHVLRGWPWSKFQPRLILCEFENEKTLPLGYDFNDLTAFLEQRGYRLIISEWYPLESYGGNHRWRRFVRYPCTLEDNNGWGNIFATCDDVLYDRLITMCNLK